MSIFRRKKKDPDPICQFMTDVYDRLLVINEMYFSMIDKLYDNGLLTYNQSRELMNITLDQIKDPEEREKQKKELNDETVDDGRMDSGS